MDNPMISPAGVASPLKRYEGNPVLTWRDVPYPATLVYNAGVARFHGRYVMLFRNDYGRWGDPKTDGTNIGLAWSDDGAKWEVTPEPCITTEKARQWVRAYAPHHNTARDLLFLNDPRLTVIEGRVYCCLAMFTAHGLRGATLVTDDFHDFELLDLTVPDNRNLILFPGRHRGKYLRFERPFNNYGDKRMSPGRYDIWVSESPDLTYWGRSRRVLSHMDVPYANDRVGAGPQPICTSRGWLTIFHAVYRDETWGKHGWEAKWTRRYDAGVMLLDLEDPTRVLAVSRYPILSPEMPYEIADGNTFESSGFRGYVVFPSGVVVEEDGSFKLYYGAADSFVCLATGHVDDLLEFCLQTSSGPASTVYQPESP